MGQTYSLIRSLGLNSILSVMIDCSWFLCGLKIHVPLLCHWICHPNWYQPLHQNLHLLMNHPKKQFSISPFKRQSSILPAQISPFNSYPIPSHWHPAGMGTWGMILTKITGVVPRSICGMFSFKMPQRTLVGKSGPATRMQTLPKANPAGQVNCQQWWRKKMAIPHFHQ